MQKEFIPIPIAGTVVKLEDLKDEIFARKVLGQGFAVKFTGSRLVSPLDGTVIATFPTGHAYIVRRDDGLEVLMHVGLNSAKLPAAFKTCVKKYQKVKKGDVLTEVDPDLFADRTAYCPVTFSNPQIEVIVDRYQESVPELCGDAVRALY